MPTPPDDLAQLLVAVLAYRPQPWAWPRPRPPYLPHPRRPPAQSSGGGACLLEALGLRPPTPNGPMIGWHNYRSMRRRSLPFQLLAAVLTAGPGGRGWWAIS
jgi:hypothetical protein